MGNEGATETTVKGPRRSLTPQTTDVLLALLDANPIALSRPEVVRKTGLSAPTVRQILATLTDWQWVSIKGIGAITDAGGPSSGCGFQLTTFGLDVAEVLATDGRVEERSATIRRMALSELLSVHPSGMHGRRISRRVGFDPSNVHGELAELTHQGLVSRKTQTSGRGAAPRNAPVVFTLTPAGLDAARRAGAEPADTPGDVRRHGPVSDRTLLTLLDTDPVAQSVPGIRATTGVSARALYPTLFALEQCGRVRACVVQGCREQTYYALTQSGRIAAREVAVPKPERHPTPWCDVTNEVLAVLLKTYPGEVYGFEVASALGDGRSSIYGSLRGLAARKLVTSRREQIDPDFEGRPPRVYYRLTEAGVKAAEESVVPPSVSATPQDVAPTPRRKRTGMKGEILLVLLDAMPSSVYSLDVATTIGTDRPSARRVLVGLVESGLAESRKRTTAGRGATSRHTKKVFYRLTPAGIGAAERYKARRSPDRPAYTRP